MKRYLLFGFDSYYPSGGWNDFIDSFDSIIECIEKSAGLNRDHYQIVDSTTGNEVR